MISTHRISVCASLIAATLATAPASADKRSLTAIVRIEVSPVSPVLDGREARQQLLVTGRRADGRLVDLTDTARCRASDEGRCRIEAGCVVRPIRDGRTRIAVEAAGLRIDVPVLVRGTTRRFAWSFENHVESVFSKQGCNAGPCHGAASGKGGLRLTLRGFDPDLDYVRLRLEGSGRRVVKTLPDDSLILRKPSLRTAHLGGLRLRRDSLEYRVVREWIASGARGPSPNSCRLLNLSVFPPERTLEDRGKQHLLVIARFSDGHTEDVTHWARYSSNEEPIASVDESGLVTMRKRGETTITVWYLGKVAFTRVSVPYNGGTAAWGYGNMGSVGVTPHTPHTPHASTPSFIDDLVDRKLSNLGLRPSGRCSDREFVRRAMLDTVGTLPTAEETRAFVSDSRQDNRARLIDMILARPEFVDFWTYKWDDLLRVNRDALGDKGMAALHAWVREGVAANKPWDQFAREVLTATGSAASCGPANFYRMGERPEEFSETVSQAFLGIRIQCAHCHNHPFEKWTQSDYYRMASFFARVGRKAAGGEDLIFAAAQGNVSHPKVGRPLPPAAFDGPSIPLNAPGDRRTALADWMTSPSNPYFARSLVNRVWKQFMGRGLVEPVDDMRLTNPASNEALLHALARDFASHGFDIKRLIRSILRSDAYQRTSATTRWNRDDDRFYSHFLPRRLSAEALLDAIDQVTGATEKFAGVPSGARAISLPDTRIDSPFLDIFGRPARQITCECERGSEPNVAQTLHLINSAELNTKITAKAGTLSRLLASGKSDDLVLDALYMACLSRAPFPAERATLHHALGAGPVKPDNRYQVLADLFWALLSSPEFVYNH